MLFRCSTSFAAALAFAATLAFAPIAAFGQGSASPVPAVSPAQTPSDRIAMRLLRLEPADAATIDRKRPEISATFSETIDPGTIRLAIDGRDVTPETFVSSRGFVYDLRSDLPVGKHGVSVSGKTPDREAFSEHWTFSTRDGDNAATNYISGLEPPSGTKVSASITVSAFTRPKAHVRLVVATSETIANFSDVTGGSSTTDTVADGHGYFEVHIPLADRSASVVDVRIVSNAPDGSLAVRTLRLRQ